MNHILSNAGIDFAAATVVDDLEGAKKLLLRDVADTTATRIAAIRFVFPASSNHQLLKYLYQMNITGSSLFPDQEGAIQNLKNEFHLLRCMASMPKAMCKTEGGLPKSLA